MAVATPAIRVNLSPFALSADEIEACVLEIERKRKYSSDWYHRNKTKARTASADWERRNRSRKSETQRTRRSKTGEKFAYDIQKRYGLTVEAYAELLKSQGGGCAICGVERNPDGRRLVVDHDHATGFVRGILCHRCNTGIGAIGDSLESVRRAVAYLARAHLRSARTH